MACLGLAHLASTCKQEKLLAPQENLLVPEDLIVLFSSTDSSVYCNTFDDDEFSMEKHTLRVI